MKALFLTTVPLNPRESAAAVRTLGLCQELRRLGWEVVCLTPRLNQALDLGPDESLGTPDVVIYDRFVTEERMRSRVEGRWPSVLHVIDTQDLHFLRRARVRGLDPLVPTEDMIRELAAIYRSDLSLVLSTFEVDLLSRLGVAPDLVHLCPLFFPAAGEQPSRLAPREGFGFIGNYRHVPNHGGVMWFVSQVWPLVRAQLPHATLHLAGAFAPREISALHSPGTGIVFHGQVDDAGEFLRARHVNLAPLLSGAGMKGKILSGWSVGTPCVSTPIGAEGMGEPFGGLVAETADSFAAACVRLSSDGEVWQRLSAIGIGSVTRDFVGAKITGALASRLTRQRANTESHRARNLVGQMLRLSLNQGLKYFSKWIELKEGEKNAGAPVSRQSIDTTCAQRLEGSAGMGHWGR